MLAEHLLEVDGPQRGLGRRAVLNALTVAWLLPDQAQS